MLSVTPGARHKTVSEHNFQLRLIFVPFFVSLSLEQSLFISEGSGEGEGGRFSETKSNPLAVYCEQYVIYAVAGTEFLCRVCWPLCVVVCNFSVVV